MSSADEEEESYYEGEQENTQLLNAHEVTLIATNFLRTLGNKRGLKPIKASLEEEKYTVDVQLRKKIATMQIDAINGGINRYEIKDKVKEPSTFFPPTQKNILLICGIVAISIFISGLLGIQSFLPRLF